MEFDYRIGKGGSIEHAIKAGVHYISIGDEGCVYRLPNKSEIKHQLEQIFGMGIKARFVTPKAGEREINVISNAVRTVAEFGKEVDLIINDLGVLQICRKMKLEYPNINIILGRLMTRSIIDCPWGELAIRNESSEIKEDFKRHSYDQKEKIELMHQVGVKGIEVNSIKGIADSITRIMENNIDVSVHFDRRLLTVGRNCITARYYSVKFPHCKAVCGKEFNIEWDGLWLSPLQNDIAVEDIHKKMLEGAIVIGNRVLAPGNSSIEDIRKANPSVVIIENLSELETLKDSLHMAKEV